MTYVISYDLNIPGQDYSDLYEEIKKLGSWCHPVDSTWYVVTDLTADSIRDSLVKVIDNSDAIIVTRASAPGAWNGLKNEVSDWLKINL